MKMHKQFLFVPCYLLGCIKWNWNDNIHQILIVDINRLMVHYHVTYLKKTFKLKRLVTMSDICEYLYKCHLVLHCWSVEILANFHAKRLEIYFLTISMPLPKNIVGVNFFLKISLDIRLLSNFSLNSVNSLYL